MATEYATLRPHLIPENTRRAEGYTARGAGGSRRQQVTAKDGLQHSNALRAHLRAHERVFARDGRHELHRVQRMTRAKTEDRGGGLLKRQCFDVRAHVHALCAADGRVCSTGAREVHARRPYARATGTSRQSVV